MTVGVICHLPNPTFAQVRALAEAAEDGGADWLGLPDAFWWRDTWLLVAEAARSTERLWIGPVVTNPYLRHPFHTVSALATLQDLAGPRVHVGLAAGGSEVTGAAGVSRQDAPARIEALASLIRHVAAGAPLDGTSGLRLDVPLASPPIMVAGRANAVLRSAGRVGDRALLWSVPRSDLVRSADLVRKGAKERSEGPAPAPAGSLELVWAPAVAHDEATRERLVASAPYAVLNSGPRLHERWGLAAGALDAIRRQVLAGNWPDAAMLLPPAAIDDLILSDPDPQAIGTVARDIGAAGIGIAVFDVATVGDRVAWARAVMSEAS